MVELLWEKAIACEAEASGFAS